MATVANLVIRCASRFRDVNNAINSPTDWLAYLNDAYDWVNSECGANAWPQMENTTTLTFGIGVATVPLPTDTHRVVSVWDATDQVILIPIKGWVTPKARFGDTSTGAPGFYRIFGGQMTVYPTPTVSTNLTVDYLSGPIPLTSGGGNPTPPFPSEYHQVLVEYALGLAYLDDGAADMSKAHMTAASAILVQLQVALMGGQEDSLPQIVDSFYNV